MSLTSYQAAPPRVANYVGVAAKSKSKIVEKIVGLGTERSAKIGQGYEGIGG
jgi:hypothetical protein